MSKRTIRGITIECIQGDIAQQPNMEAIVNAANAALQPGGGVAGAVHRAAGPGLAREGNRLAPIRPGQAVMTGGHDLPNRHVIHCLGPVYGRDEPSDELLAACYREALRLAAENRMASIAFPAISTGAFGYPAAAATHIAITTVLDRLADLPPPEHIRFVLFSDADRQRYERQLDELAPGS